MSLLVIGLSHKDAPLSLLEATSMSSRAQSALESGLLAAEHIAEAVVISTCNRTEVYAECVTFHGALAELTETLSAQTGVGLGQLQSHLYVHYGDRAIAHAFAVAAGLESMAIGESQVLGQVRESLSRAQSDGHVGPELNALLQQALRVGKRVHSETRIDEVSQSLVQTGLARAVLEVGPLDSANVVILGAGGMGALAATTVSRLGARSLTIVNRSSQRAERVAARLGATARPWSERLTMIATADIVIASTGASELIVTAEQAAIAQRSRRAQQVYIDLAMPHDVDEDAAQIEQVSRIGLAELGALLAGAAELPAVKHTQDIVTAEVAAYLTAQAAAAVTPTVAALRIRAGELVDAELDRLDRRLPNLGPKERAEVGRAVHRIVEKLLHAPTVRVKEKARSGQGGSYARALGELFDLDPHTVSVVSTPPVLPDFEDHAGGAR